MKFVATIFIALATSAHVCAASVASRPAVVVTTSMLESAVYDLFGDDLPFDLERIIPPGNCPGHFDLRPQTLNRIRNSSLFVYHHYQAGIENRVKDQARSARLLRIAIDGSYLIPENYGRTVEKIRAAFVDEYPEIEDKGQVDSVSQVEDLWREAAEEHGWKGVPVIASQLQAGFCEWVGFEVVGILRRPEDMTPQDLAKLLTSGAEMIVANRQSDSQSARMLSERLSLPAAILGNFPDDKEPGTSPYYRQAQMNLEALLEAWRNR